MSALSPEVERLLVACRDPLALSQAKLQPVEEAASIVSRGATLFPGARHGQAALAGLLLRLGHWDASHTVAQDVASAEGSYWHAIIHRIEPDSGNSGYWFRRVGTHPIFPELLERAAEVLKEGGPPEWRLKSVWDPFLFIDWCDEARKRGGEAEAAALEIQMAEWKLLFGWCVE